MLYIRPPFRGVKMTNSKIIDTGKETVRETARLAEATIKKAWSIMDAAAEKMRPSQYLSEKAIKAIQGRLRPEE